MIVTLTANPSHDRTVTLSEPLIHGAVQRAVSVLSQAGRQGRQHLPRLRRRRCPDAGRDPARPSDDDPFVLERLSAGIDCRPVDHPGDLRVNITISDPDRTDHQAQQPRPRDDRRDARVADRGAAASHHDGDWVVLAGSLPPQHARRSGTAEPSARCRDAGARMPVDTSDQPLRALVEPLEVGAPHLMKPNGHELASLTGHDGDEFEKDPVAAARAALEFVGRGVESVLVTLGGDRAVLVTGGRASTTRRRPRPRGQHRWVRTNPACSATCWSPWKAASPPTGWRSPSPTAAPPPGSPDHHPPPG